MMSIVVIKSRNKDKDQSKTENYSDTPFVSILVATYNEEKVIANRVENLFDLNYPNDKYEILVVDSDSTDKTRIIVKALIQKSNLDGVQLKLIEESERKGKASAINIGKKIATGELVLIADANSIFDKDVLKELVPHFEDPSVGAVSGRYFVSNPNNTISSSESFYWGIEYITLLGESFLDSIATVIGTISIWRKNLMDFRSDTLTEDLDMAIQVRRKGFKVKYEPNAKVYEPCATVVVDQIKQRKRISIGTIQNIFQHIGFFICPTNLYSLLIFPSHKILVMLSPFMLLGIFVLYLVSWNATIIAIHFTISLFIFAVMFLVLLFLKSRLIDDEVKSSFSIASIPKIVYYVLLNEYLILLAWYDFAFRRYSVLWDRAESTRNEV